MQSGAATRMYRPSWRTSSLAPMLEASLTVRDPLPLAITALGCAAADICLPSGFTQVFQQMLRYGYRKSRELDDNERRGLDG